MRFPNADIAFARDTLVTIMRAVAAKRAIEAAGPQRTSTFWHVINGGLFDTAIVDWCILFGSDNAAHQPLHWKNMFGEEAFREGLLAHLEVSRGEFSAYRDQLKTYRDENAAHRDLNPRSATYPNMDLALRSCAFYFEQLRQRVAEISPEQAKLDFVAEYETSFDAFSELAKIALASTAASGLAGG